MIIQTTHTFDKQYAKLSPKLQAAFRRRVVIFGVDPFAPVLRNHPLKGKYLGYRSIDVTGDVRALYAMQGETVTLFGFIGTHSQLY